MLLAKQDLRCKEGTLVLSEDEWCDLLELLLKKRPDLANGPNGFKERTIRVRDSFVITKGRSCLFKEKRPDGHFCVLHELTKGNAFCHCPVVKD